MISVLATFMEMTEPPAGTPAASLLEGTSVAIERLDVGPYLELYRRVGEPIQWDSRLRMPASELAERLAHPSTSIHVLRLDGHPVGFCEFNGVGGSEVELAYFGLDPAVHRRGLGSFLLQTALRRCWTGSPRRIWLRTDTNDDPSAIHVYAKAGFTAYRSEIQHFDD
jgi:GNAT superfamily N-acetyltransferase